jgi:hypothetical protein
MYCVFREESLFVEIMTNFIYETLCIGELLSSSKRKQDPSLNLSKAVACCFWEEALSGVLIYLKINRH